MQGHFSKPDFFLEIFLAFLFCFGIGFSGPIFAPGLTPEQEASRAALAAFNREQTCLGTTLWYEARGEPPSALGGVLDVVEARSKNSGLPVCQVIAQPHQFSWYTPSKIVPLDSERRHLLELAHQNRKLAKNRWFYSGKKPTWAVNMLCNRLGRLHFCRKK